MEIFKNIDETDQISESKFAYTMKCLSKANWTTDYDFYNNVKLYLGYSDKNMIKARASRFPEAYRQYRLSFPTDKTAHLENNNSSFWFIKFKSQYECKKFKKQILTKFFDTPVRDTEYNHIAHEFENIKSISA